MLRALSHRHEGEAAEFLARPRLVLNLALQHDFGRQVNGGGSVVRDEFSRLLRGHGPDLDGVVLAEGGELVWSAHVGGLQADH